MHARPYCRLESDPPVSFATEDTQAPDLLNQTPPRETSSSLIQRVISAFEGSLPPALSLPLITNPGIAPGPYFPMTALSVTFSTLAGTCICDSMFMVS